MADAVLLGELEKKIKSMKDILILIAFIILILTLGHFIAKDIRKREAIRESYHYWIQRPIGSSIFGGDVVNYYSDSIISKNDNGIIFYDNHSSIIQIVGLYQLKIQR